MLVAHGWSAVRQLKSTCRWPTYLIPLYFYCLEMSRKKQCKRENLVFPKGLQLLIKASCYQVLELLAQVAPIINQFSPYFFPQVH